MYKLQGVIFIMAAAILFGIMPIWVKMAYSTGLTSQVVVLLRSGMAAVILGGVIYYRKKDFHVKREQMRPLLISTVLGYSGTIVTLYASYEYINSGVATSLHYLYPVLVMLIVQYLYHKKLQFYKWLTLFISLTGIFLISEPLGSGFSSLGVGLALGSALFFSIYTLSINNPLLKCMDSLVLAFYACLMTSFISIILLIVQEKWPPVVTIKGLFYTSLVSFFCTVMALLLFIEGVKIIGSANASILSTMEPVVSLVAGTIILHEQLTLCTIIGCILIVSAVILIGYKDLSKDSIYLKKMIHSMKGK
jgi:drug/metabolite transporter (DMT)-like permease